MNYSHQEIEKIIKPHILRCRPGDWNHARRVAKWVHVLAQNRKDLDMLLLAAYIHDIGWRNVFVGDKISLDLLEKLDPQAVANSEPFIRGLLGDLDFKEDDIQTVLRLVTAADTYTSQRDDEEIIVDADGLSKLDIDHLKEKFEPKSWPEMLVWLQEKEKEMKTEKGRQLYPELLDQLRKDVNTV